MMTKNIAADDDRFTFGENWKSFLVELDDARIAEIENSLRWLLGRDRLDGMRFLDVGSGSGLSSLGARRLGAKVVSFDFDPKSVECTQMLRHRLFPNDPDWRVEQGSILDRDYLDGLGQFDVVYSWGVLHHTGAMHTAIENAARLVAPGGTFAIALYRKTPLCALWALEKRWYCRASPRVQTAAHGIYVGLLRCAFALTGRDFKTYVANYRSKRRMNFRCDVHDWSGGYPYESIRPEDVDNELTALGFSPLRSN